MASTVTVKVEGLSDLSRRLKNLSDEVTKKIARSATASAAGVIKKAAQAKVPVDTGNLRKNIIVKRLPKGESSLTSEHIVTVRQGKRTKKQKDAGVRDAWYGSLVEFGTARAPAQPFMRPALDENGDKAVQAMKSTIERRLKKFES